MTGHLICIGGLPAVGKTTVARYLHNKLKGSILLDPDKIRLSVLDKNPEIDRLLDEDITPESTDATVREMKDQLISALAQNKTVIIGSAFTGERMRAEYEAAALERGAVFGAVWLEAKNEIRQARAEKRLNEEDNPSAVSVNNDLEIEGKLEWSVIDASQAIKDVYKDMVAILKI